MAVLPPLAFTTGGAYHAHACEQHGGEVRPQWRHGMPVRHPAYLLLHMIDKYPHFFHRGMCQPQQRPLSRATIQGLTALSTAQPLAKCSNVCLTRKDLHSRHLVATQADLVPTSWRSLPDYLLTCFLLAGYSLLSTPTKQAFGAPAVVHTTWRTARLAL